MTLEKLTTEEFVKLYKNILPQDFTEEELKPISKVKKLSLNDISRCYCLFKDKSSRDFKSILSYAIISRTNVDDETRYLLEYFSVNPNYRSCGIGSKMLQKLIKKLNSTIYLEVEDPKYAGSEKEAKICKKRIEFYKRNGIIKSPVSVKLYDGHYNILYANKCREVDGNTNLTSSQIKNDLNIIYSNTSDINLTSNIFISN